MASIFRETSGPIRNFPWMLGWWNWFRYVAISLSVKFVNDFGIVVAGIMRGMWCLWTKVEKNMIWIFTCTHCGTIHTFAASPRAILPATKIVLGDMTIQESKNFDFGNSSSHENLQGYGEHQSDGESQGRRSSRTSGTRCARSLRQIPAGLFVFWSVWRVHQQRFSSEVLEPRNWIHGMGLWASRKIHSYSSGNIWRWGPLYQFDGICWKGGVFVAKHAIMVSPLNEN